MSRRVLCYLCLTMMFNGLMMYGDSDTSDFTKESIGSSSRAGSAASEARSRCLENKLLATLQVLKNKEETVRVQAESLALAEARIAALQAARRHDHSQPLHSTRTSADGCCVDTEDVTAQTQEDELGALRDNLSIVEDLYRECFYESARQDAVIDVLRASCGHVRRARPRRSHRSPHHCQDIAQEVENLKSEISDFLNNSNNDSGMWERGEEPAAAALDELHAIAAQLQQLRRLLIEGCSCGLEEENLKLKGINETLEERVEDLQQRVCSLEAALADKENAGQRHQRLLRDKEQELSSLQQQLATLQPAAAERDRQLQTLQETLRQRTSELTSARRECERLAGVADQLRLELGRAQTLAKEENGKVRQEVRALSTAADDWRRRLAALERALQSERRRCKHLEEHCRERSQAAAALQEQLEAAHAAGTALCRDSLRSLCDVRRWISRVRTTQREQEQKIEEQSRVIDTLQRRVTWASEPACSRTLRTARAGRSQCAATSDDSGPPPPPRSERAGDKECQWPTRCDACSQRPARSDAHTLSDEPTHEESTDEVAERVERAHAALVEARRRWRRARPS